MVFNKFRRKYVLFLISMLFSFLVSCGQKGTTSQLQNANSGDVAAQESDLSTVNKWVIDGNSIYSGEFFLFDSSTQKTLTYTGEMNNKISLISFYFVDPDGNRTQIRVDNSTLSFSFQETKAGVYRIIGSYEGLETPFISLNVLGKDDYNSWQQKITFNFSSDNSNWTFDGESFPLAAVFANQTPHVISYFGPSFSKYYTMYVLTPASKEIVSPTDSTKFPLLLNISCNENGDYILGFYDNISQKRYVIGTFTCRPS